MKRLWSLISAAILLITCSGCFWDVEHDRGRHGDGDRDGYRHDDRGDHDRGRGPDDRDRR